MRIAQLNPLPAPAGWRLEDLRRRWSTSFEVARACADAGADVVLVQPADHTLEQRDGRLTTRLLEVSESSPRAHVQILRALRAVKPDLIHVHGLGYPLLFGALRAAFPRTPVLAQDHANQPPTGARKHVHRTGVNALSAVLFVHREQARPFVDAGVLSGELPVFEILEGSSHFRPGAREAARETSGLWGSPCLLWVGRLNRNKDPMTALAAIERAAERLPNIRLYMCFHESPILDAVENRVRMSDRLRGRVHLLGERPHAELETLYRAADGFVAASHREGSGYSAIEAMACGTPTILSRIPSFTRLAADASMLFDCGDVDGLVARIVRLSEHAPDREAVRAHFEARLSFSAIGRELLAVYRSLAEGTTAI